MADVNSAQFEPSSKLKPGEYGGRVRRAVGVASVSAGSPGSGEAINFFKLPRNAVIVDIMVANATGNGITAGDLGEDVSGKTDLLMDGLDLDTSGDNSYKASDNQEGTNGWHADTADNGKELWEILGYSAATDASQEITISLTANAACDATDVIVCEILYVVD